MTIEIKVPMLPESVADATIVTWHKKPGDTIRQEDNLVDLETDKVVLEVPSPEDGVLKEILKVEGEVVKSGELLAVIEPGEVLKEASAPTEEKQSVTEKVDASDSVELSPAVRRLVAEHNVDVNQVTPTGKGGRIVKEDIMKFVNQQQPAKAVEQTRTMPAGAREEKRVPMSRIRARIAERLLDVTQNTAMLTTFNEVNLQKVVELRKRYKESFEKQHGVRLGFMSFFVKAAVEALKQLPAVNASIDGDDIVYHGFFDIGVAVSTDRGLVVPVLRDADQMSMAQIEKEIIAYATKAREGKLTLEEMQGGTFTITNGGVFGSMLSTPILNAPQSGILGMHNIAERPVVENGEIVIRPMMYIALSYDHRVVDGKESVTFLVKIKEMLEDPTRLLLEL